MAKSRQPAGRKKTAKKPKASGRKRTTKAAVAAGKTARAKKARAGKTASPSRKKTAKGRGKNTTKVATKKAVKAPAKGRAKKTYLTGRELAEFRQMLLEKRRTLVGDLNGMEESAARGSGNISSMPTHMADVGTDTFEHEFTLGLLESEQALLSEINESLARIDAGTYGVCLGTGQKIPKARLRAKPWAKYTVDFTRRIEQGLARPPDEDEEDAD